MENTRKNYTVIHENEKDAIEAIVEVVIKTNKNISEGDVGK